MAHHLPHGPHGYPAYPAVPLQPPPSNVLPRPLHAPFVIPRAPAPPSYLQPPFALQYHTNPPYHIPTSASKHVAAVDPVPRVFPLSTTGWKDEEKLVYERDNWREYSTKNTEDNPNPCPSYQMYPAHHRAWLDTDRVVRVFLRDTLTVTERTHVAHCKTAADVWATLRYRHLARSPAGQISALKCFANISYASDPGTFAATTTLLTQCNEVIWQCGAPNPELFLLSGIISALEVNHGTIASTLLAQPNLDLAMAIATLDARHGDHLQQQGVPQTNDAHMAVLYDRGGGMVGRTVREAQTKYCADNGIPEPAPRPPKPPQVKRDGGGRAYVTLGGTDHFLVPTPAVDTAATTPAAAVAPAVVPATAHFADAADGLLTDPIPPGTDPVFTLEAWLAEEDPHVSVDWNVPMAMSTETGTYKLFADTGANIHISPCRDNFTTFTPIPPHAETA
ncbi:hypothetical protein B0H14DRAFT_3448021 [Mycena olivaceomarginata]|nr:hypothetical protein B0H14DRAFT_3448021 [Mycena olivaceomarginata]